MSNDPKPANQPANGGYERQDLGAAGVLYFLLGLLVAGVLVYFVVNGLYAFLQHRSDAEQTPLNPLVTSAPTDTRKLPAEYKGNYEEYLKKNFPAPQLEVNERGQLNDIRLKEEQTLSTYDYIDQKAGTVRIPIDRAMDLIAQRGLPVRASAAAAGSPPAQPQPAAQKKAKK